MAQLRKKIIFKSKIIRYDTDGNNLFGKKIGVKHDINCPNLYHQETWIMDYFYSNNDVIY